MKKEEGESEDAVRVKKKEAVTGMGERGEKEHRHVVVVSPGGQLPLEEYYSSS